MGKPVTLDSDIVEALLVAAECTGKIEDMFRAREDDPQAERTKPRLRDSIDTARREWGTAIREIGPDEMEPPVAGEIAALEMIYKDDVAFAINQTGDAIDIDWIASQQETLPSAIIIALRAKRLIVAGSVSTVIRWGDKTIKAQPETYQVYKLTDRGRAWCRANLK